MISTIEMEKYFKINYTLCKIHNKKLSIIAWQNGSFENCHGNILIFKKNIDVIVRNSEYDFCLNFINNDIYKIQAENNKNITRCTKGKLKNICQGIITKNKASFAPASDSF